jgi:hypothetical protein
MSVIVDRNQIKVIVGDLVKITERIIVKLALDITANLKNTTPVDTGWARANWLPSIGVPATPIGNPISRVERSAVVGSAQGQQAAAEAGLLRYRLSSGSVFIRNNVPYIGSLNAGSSAKAPAGFVQAAIKQGVLDLAGFRP